MTECLICCEEREVMIVGDCDHMMVCLECTYKLRSISKNKTCIYCKKTLEKVVATSDKTITWDRIPLTKLREFEWGIYTIEDKSREDCEQLNRAVCSVPKCKNPDFSSKNALAKHLQEVHNRKFCNLCLENRALLVSQQPVFREAELSRHLAMGEFDEAGIVVFLHPRCKFCAKHFFNEETFLLHMKTDHLKCEICKSEDQKFVFYDKVDNLAIHLRASHYACNDKACEAKRLIAYATFDELLRHSESHSGTKTKKNENLFERVSAVKTAEKPISDKEGFDVAPQLLSLQKSTGGNKTSGISLDKSGFDYLDVMEMLVDSKPKTIEDERDLLDLHHDGPSTPKGKEKTPNPLPTFEEIKFVRAEGPACTFKAFEGFLVQLLRREEESSLLKSIAAFQNRKASPADLFDAFAKIFGPVLCYKYFHFYSRTFDDKAKEEQLATELQRRLSKVPFKNQNIISKAKGWKQVFEKVSEEISHNVKRRIDTGSINLKSEYKINPMRLVQLVRSVKTLSLREIVRLKFLSNFVQDSEDKLRLQRSFLIPVEQVQEELSKIGNVDILIMFVYFSIVELLFDPKIQISDNTIVNPNLLKIFMRHFPDLAKARKFDLNSDEEDYEETTTKPSIQQAKIAHEQEKAQKSKKWETAQPVSAPKIEIKKKVQVFANDGNTSSVNVDNIYDFPELQGASKKPVQAKSASSNATSAGWGKSGASAKGWGPEMTLSYQNEIIRRRALEEEFPELGKGPANDEPQEPKVSKKEDLFARMYKKSEVPEESIQPAQGGNQRNIFEAMKSTSTTGIEITKIKSKKKSR